MLAEAPSRVRIDVWPDPNEHIGEETPASADGMLINRQVSVELPLNGLSFISEPSDTVDRCF